MNKKYPASESKLKTLKAKGIFVKSNYFLNSIKFFLFCLFLNLICNFDYSKYLFFKEDIQFVNYNILIKVLFLFFSIMLLLNLVNLVFSKFYFNLGLVVPRFSRFYSPKKILSLNTFLHLICLILLVLILFRIAENSFEEFILLSFRKTYFISQYKVLLKMLASFSLKISTIFLSFGVCSYFINWLCFRFDHMMTEEEYQAEVREQQARRYG